MTAEFAGPLAEYYVAARDEAAVREASVPLEDLKLILDGMLPIPPVGFMEAITASDDVAVIAEYKRKSPTKGEIQTGRSVEWAVGQYEAGGAAAVSVLTQEADFGGELADLANARYATRLPILRKDFISNSYQLHEARAFGAAAVLLIVAGLPDAKLLDLYEEARGIGLDCLVEVHDRDDLERALQIGPDIIGINNRDLNTGEIDLGVTAELIGEIPDTVTTVSESGYNVRDQEQMHYLRVLKANAVLIGTSLMLEAEPAATLEAWRAA
jgi:indole-3-glycerol phosphate synthase